MRLVWGVVLDADPPSGGSQHLLVATSPSAEPSRALAFPQLTGVCVVGETVVLNTTAVDLGLGTGGYHFVVARHDAAAGAPVSGDAIVDAPSGGHIMKLRYTPLQVDVNAVEEPGGASYEVMQRSTSIDGMPVVCCGLHSQMPLVAAAIKAARPSARIAYCHTDFGSLPYALSSVARHCRDAGLVDVSISCGQSFGADIEAVNLHSGLLAARHVAACDAAIVAIGPGMVGTATPFGHGGVAQGEALNAVHALGGHPVAVLRVSFADPRERHRVLSHHSLTALTRIALTSAAVAVPCLPTEQASALEAALDAAGVWTHHRRADAPGEIDRDALRGVEPRSMGRGMTDDPAFFAAAYAAGQVAAGLLGGEGSL